MNIDCAIYALHSAGWQTLAFECNDIYGLTAYNGEHWVVAMSDDVFEVAEAIISMVQEILA